MKKFTCAALFALCVSSLPGAAFADHADAVNVHVKFCAASQFEARIESYDGSDGAMTTPRRKKWIRSNNGTKVFSCRGEGKGRCKLKIYVNSSTAGVGQTKKVEAVKDGKWLKIDAPSESGTSVNVSLSESDSEPSCSTPASPSTSGPNSDNLN